MRKTANRVMFSDSCSKASVQLKRGVSAGNIKINAVKTQPIYSSHRFRPPVAHIILNGRNIPLPNHVKKIVSSQLLGMRVYTTLVMIMESE
jgi:hypothetical protein